MRLKRSSRYRHLIASALVLTMMVGISDAYIKNIKALADTEDTKDAEMVIELPKSIIDEKERFILGYFFQGKFYEGDFLIHRVKDDKVLEKIPEIQGIKTITMVEGENIPDLLEGVSLDSDSFSISVDKGNLNPSVTGSYEISYNVVDSDGKIVSSTPSKVDVLVRLSKHVKGLEDRTITAHQLVNLFEGVKLGECIKEVVLDDSNINYDVAGEYVAKYSILGNDGRAEEITVKVTVVEPVSEVMVSTSKVYTGENLVGSTIEEQTYNYLIAKGLNPIQVSGIMGNISQESRWNSNSVEKSNGVGFGLLQWSKGRRQNLENYANVKGTSSGDVKTQLDFLWLEFDPNADRQGYCRWQFGGNEYWYNAFLNATTPEEACRAFCKGFVRCNEALANYPYRISEAQRFYDMFAN